MLRSRNLLKVMDFHMTELSLVGTRLVLELMFQTTQGLQAMGSCLRLNP